MGGPNFVKDDNSDCDDSNPNISRTLFPDADGDGFGNGQIPVCSAPAEEEEEEKRGAPVVALVEVGGDCDDTNALVNPDQVELCNGIDDNCNGVVDEGCPPSPPETPSSSISTTTVPAASLPSVPSLPVVIVVPTPLPPSPSTPQVVLVSIDTDGLSLSAASSLFVFPRGCVWCFASICDVNVFPLMC